MPVITKERTSSIPFSRLGFKEKQIFRLFAVRHLERTSCLAFYFFFFVNIINIYYLMLNVMTAILLVIVRICFLYRFVNQNL